MNFAVRSQNAAVTADSGQSRAISTIFRKRIFQMPSSCALVPVGVLCTHAYIQRIG